MNNAEALPRWLELSITATAGIFFGCIFIASLYKAAVFSVPLGKTITENMKVVEPINGKQRSFIVQNEEGRSRTLNLRDDYYQHLKINDKVLASYQTFLPGTAFIETRDHLIFRSLGESAFCGFILLFIGNRIRTVNYRRKYSDKNQTKKWDSGDS